VIIPEGFARDLGRGTTPAIQILLDGTNSNTAAIARGYALKVVDVFHRSLPAGTDGATAGFQPQLRVW
jgi:ABC-2 type transport system permease protein